MCTSCIDGYYFDSNDCIKCPNKFSKCTDSLTGIECLGKNRNNITP